MLLILLLSFRLEAFALDLSLFEFITSEFEKFLQSTLLLPPPELTDDKTTVCRLLAIPPPRDLPPPCLLVF
jgi:hypothetical protein